jgi:hypothetical protein
MLVLSSIMCSFPDQYSSIGAMVLVSVLVSV